MAGFQFRLQAVAELRQTERDQARGELADAVARQRRCEQAAQACENRIAEEQSARAKGLAQGCVNIASLRAAALYATELQKEWAAAQAAQRDAAQAVERRQQELVEADRQVRLFEKLRERQETAFCQQQAQRECQAADEAGTVGYFQAVAARLD